MSIINLTTEKVVTPETSTGSKVNVSDIEALMKRVKWVTHSIPGTTSTYVHAYLDGNFYLATGFSGCVSPSNYKKEIGVEYAFERAKEEAYNKLWMLEGWRLYHSINSNGSTGGFDTGHPNINQPMMLEEITSVENGEYRLDCYPVDTGNQMLNLKGVEIRNDVGVRVGEPGFLVRSLLSTETGTKDEGPDKDYFELWTTKKPETANADTCTLSPATPIGIGLASETGGCASSETTD